MLLGLSLWTLCFYVYLSKQPVNYTYDGMVFASRIENPQTPLYDLFHPHHLIYTFLGRLFYLWGTAHGATWDGMVALQFFDILIGSLGILLAFHLLVRKTRDPVMATLTCLGLSFTFSYWYFSTSPGVRIFAAVTPLLTWYLLTYLKDQKPLFAIVIGLAHALAVLGHQTNLLLIPAFLGGIACIREYSFTQRFRASIYYLLTLTAGVLTAYAFVGRFIYMHKTFESWIYWVFAYFHVQQWGGYQSAAGFEQGKFAMVQAFLAKSHPYDELASPFTFEFVQNLFVNTIFVLMAFLLIRFKLFWQNYRQTMWVGVCWVGAFVPFFLWWEPWNIEFWVSSTIPCWLLIGVTASALSQRWTNPVLHVANRGLVILAGVGLITLLYLYNFHASVRQTAVLRSPKPLMEAVDWKVRKDDLLILTGVNTVPFYIDRYQKRNYLNLHAFLKKYEPKKEKVKPAKKASSAAPPDPWTDLNSLMEKTWKRHRKIWALDEVVNENNEWNMKFEGFSKLPRGIVSRFFQQYPLKPIAYHGKVYYYEVQKPIPTPTPVLETTLEVMPPPIEKKKFGKRK